VLVERAAFAPRLPVGDVGRQLRHRGRVLMVHRDPERLETGDVARRPVGDGDAVHRVIMQAGSYPAAAVGSARGATPTSGPSCLPTSSGPQWSPPSAAGTTGARPHPSPPGTSSNGGTGR